jgi:Ser-tRNA(Ala) deacylase AlaX
MRRMSRARSAATVGSGIEEKTVKAATKSTEASSKASRFSLDSSKQIAENRARAAAMRLGRRLMPTNWVAGTP